MIKKKCARCGKKKDLNEFHKHKSNKDGKNSYCRFCNTEMKRIEKIKYPEKYILKNAKYRAEKNGIPFNLKLKDIIIPKVCPIFKKPFVYGIGRQEFSPSLDRIKNVKGYVKGNIVVISWRANKIKSNATVKELKALSDFYNNLEIK